MAYVVVYLNGVDLKVPRVVNDHWAFRGALGVPRADSVAHERDPAKVILASSGWTFDQGERFVTIDARQAFDSGEREAIYRRAVEASRAQKVRPK